MSSSRRGDEEDEDVLSHIITMKQAIEIAISTADISQNAVCSCAAPERRVPHAPSMPSARARHRT